MPQLTFALQGNTALLPLDFVPYVKLDLSGMSLVQRPRFAAVHVPRATPVPQAAPMPQLTFALQGGTRCTLTNWTPARRTNGAPRLTPAQLDCPHIRNWDCTWLVPRKEDALHVD